MYSFQTEWIHRFHNEFADSNVPSDFRGRSHGAMVLDKRPVPSYNLDNRRARAYFISLSVRDGPV